MASLDEVYRKFGEVAEAAQLLETQLGTVLIMVGCIDAGLLDRPSSTVAAELFGRVDRQTLGHLIKGFRAEGLSADDLEVLLKQALDERNRLARSFYRQHIFRRNSEQGCALMLEDLESIHSVLLDAYKAVLSRESLYKALSENGNPSYATVLKVVRALCVRFHAEPTA